MRTYEAFTLGAITGAAIVWFWRREIEDFARDKTRGVRTQAAEGLHAVADSTETVFDRAGDALRRAEELVKNTKQQVGDVLRTGQDAIRPTPAPRNV